MSPSGSDPSQARVGGRSASHWWLIGAIFFVSGAISLVYQVLWMKELGLLFGNTAHATATTLTAFFLGLAAGGWFGGRLAPRLGHPLRAYGILELCIAASALLYFVLFDLYTLVYPSLFQMLGHQRETFLLIKFLLGVLVLFPASFFMGGTLPVLGEHMVRTPEALGRGGTALYAVNTLGAAVGAAAAGFMLPALIGFDRTYLLAMGLNVGIGAVVILIARRGTTGPPAGSRTWVPAPPLPGKTPVSWGMIRGLAALSGFVTLALEVMWTHMMAQVLHNSVYTFSIILITFLTALALGSLLAHGLIRLRTPPLGSVFTLLVVGGLLVGASPHLFHRFTHGLAYHAPGEGWSSYLFQVFGLAGRVMFLPTLLLGSVFPYLLRLSEPRAQGAGRTIGNLAAINTFAAILGSLIAGFGLLGWFGLWSGIHVLAALVMIGVFALARPVGANPPMWRVGAAAGFLFLMFFLNPRDLPLVRVETGDTPEQLLEVWEGSAGVVAVVRAGHDLRIKVDNHYTLGGTASLEVERRQGILPLLLHPKPQDVFYLGMGTGITAGAAMSHPVSTVTVCELVPDAVTAAAKYFGPYAEGLFTDPRTRILAEDGRTFLRATGDRYDVVTSDLFIPWKAGTGSLYSLEHFQTVFERLRPGGLFAQWIPAYQISKGEFEIIARTMIEVFPLVTLWRGDLEGSNPVLALMGHREDAPVDPDAVSARLKETEDPGFLIGEEGQAFSGSIALFLMAYCGNLTEARALLEGVPLNTDDRPLVEYRAPITHRRARAQRATLFVSEELMAFMEDLTREVPIQNDPYLAKMTPRFRDYVLAGQLVHKGRMQRELGRPDAAEETAIELERLLGAIAGG